MESPTGMAWDTHTQKCKQRFLERLRYHGNVTRAAREAGVSRITAYNHRHRETDFAEEWESATHEYADALLSSFTEAVTATEQVRRSFTDPETGETVERVYELPVLDQKSYVNAMKFLLERRHPDFKPAVQRHEVAAFEGSFEEALRVDPRELMEEAEAEPNG